VAAIGASPTPATRALLTGTGLAIVLVGVLLPMVDPEVGLLRLNYTHLWLGQRLGTRMVTYTPADEETGARLRELSRRAAEARL
jgi:hypothetical protein